VLYKIDTEKGEGIELAKDQAVRGVPTFVMMNAEGEALDRWVGYGKEMFIESLSGALGDLTTIEEKRARFAANPTAADAAKLASYHSSIGDYAEAVRLYREAEGMNQDPSVDYLFEIFDNTVDGLRDSTYTLDDVRATADAVVSSGQAEADDLVWVAVQTNRLGKARGDQHLLTAYLQPAIDASAGTEDEGLARWRQRLLVEHALYVQERPLLAVEYKKKSMNENWTESARELNPFCWWCFESKVNLEEAETLARKAVSLASPGQEKAQILDTLAEIYNARGNPDHAVHAMTQAVAEAPDSKYYAEQLERFRGLTGS